MSAQPLKSATLDRLYDQDFVLWCEETARLLRAGQLTGVDIEHVAEEIHDLAGRDRREVYSRLRVYPGAAGNASFETRLPASAFPSQYPYTPEQIMDFEFPPGQD